MCERETGRERERARERERQTDRERKREREKERGSGMSRLFICQQSVTAREHESEGG